MSFVHTSERFIRAKFARKYGGRRTEESNERSHANDFRRRCGSSVAVSLCDVHERAIIYKIIVRFVPDERDKHDVIRAFIQIFKCVRFNTNRMVIVVSVAMT